MGLPGGPVEPGQFALDFLKAPLEITDHVLQIGFYAPYKIGVPDPGLVVPCHVAPHVVYLTLCLLGGCP